MLTNPELVGKKFADLGNLHDSEVSSIAYDFKESVVLIGIHDLMAGFEGYESYQALSGEIRLSGIKKANGCIPSDLNGWLLSVSVSQVDAAWGIDFTFNDGSKISIGFDAICFSWNSIV